MSLTAVFLQDEMRFYEAKELPKAGRENEDIFAGIGEGSNKTQDHFPQLWCNSTQYSVNGQVSHKQTYSMHRTTPLKEDRTSGLPNDGAPQGMSA